MAATKPKKPRQTFPLFPHANGQWAKKIKGRLCYFGPWADPEGAEANYLRDATDLQAGRTPRPSPDAFTVADLCNAFLAAKEAKTEAGELAPKSFRDYLATAKKLTAAFGRTRPVADLAASDFTALRRQLARTRGPHALGTEIQRMRTCFKWGYDSGLIDRPVRYGPEFKRPKPKVFRKAKRESGPRLYEPEEVRVLLAAAREPLRTMILLGVNGGMGGTDLSELPRSAVIETDDGPVVDFARPKTEIARRFPLWPETAAALAEWRDRRPDPKKPEDADAAFLTVRGNRWVHGQTDSVCLAFNRLAERCGVKRPGVSFYGLRHLHRTLSDEVRDPVAADTIMGHRDGTMAGHYRERISDDRLRAVTDHVRGVVLGET